MAYENLHNNISFEKVKLCCGILYLHVVNTCCYFIFASLPPVAVLAWNWGGGYSSPDFGLAAPD